jgi:hypothetical protein
VPAASAARKACPRKSGLPLLLGHVLPFPCCSAVSPPPSAGCANWQDHSAGRGFMVAPAPAASILSTRKAGNVETRRHAHAAVTPASAFGNLPTAGRRIPASAKRLHIHVLGWVFLGLGPTPIARNRAHFHRRAPALVSGRPCAGHPIGLTRAPRIYSAAPIVAPRSLPLTGPKLTLIIAPFGTKRANFGHSDKKVGVCNCLSGRSGLVAVDEACERGMDHGVVRFF